MEQAAMKKRPATAAAATAAASGSANHPPALPQSTTKKQPATTSGIAKTPGALLQIAMKKRPATNGGSADGPPLRMQTVVKKRPVAASGSFDAPSALSQSVCVKKPAGKFRSSLQQSIRRRVTGKQNENFVCHQLVLPPSGKKQRRPTQLHEEQHDEQGEEHSGEPLPTPSDESLLTLQGAAVDEKGNLLTEVYQDLWPNFCREPPRWMHPDPRRPGVRATELHASFEGLRTWSDAKGCGWIAVASGEGMAPPGQTRWLGLKRWGSWRLAFLAAKLQKEVWDSPKGTVEPIEKPKKKTNNKATGQRLESAQPSQIAQSGQKRGPGRPRKDPKATQAADTDMGVGSQREKRKRPGQDAAGVTKVLRSRLKTKAKAQLLEPRSTKAAGRRRRDHGSSGGSSSARNSMPPPPPPAAEGAVGPEDPRFTHHGAVYGDDGKLDPSAYVDLKDHFVDEDAEEVVHPDPGHPGLQADEVAGGERPAFLRGLSSWSDDRGAGWKCIMRVGSNTGRCYFSKWKWGSWRMAYMLARTQRDVWLYCFSTASNVDPATAAASSTAAVTSAVAESVQAGRSVQATTAASVASGTVPDKANKRRKLSKRSMPFRK